MVVAAPQRILAWEPESAEALQYFQSIDWCRHVLNAPGLLQFKCDYQNRKTNGWDPVVSGILARPDIAGVRYFLSAIADPDTFPPLEHPLNNNKAPFASTPRADQHNENGTFNPFPQHVNFYTIGSDLTGIPQTVHGGVIAMLIDSAFAQLGFVHSDPHGQFYSGFTNVRFLRPLIVPDTSTIQPPLASETARSVGNQRDSGHANLSPLMSDTLVGVANVIVRAQINSIATKEGDMKMHVLAHVETGCGTVCAIGEGLVVEKVWKSTL
ncbi:Verlamelin biosynthesis protein B [Apiospora arundinis]|uniref:Verlamelin biosynthesis protein B n=1 Tax=Apiospora arundinis TaxID=335852 RepID=A0ABR2I8T8_9PEZI